MEERDITILTAVAAAEVGKGRPEGRGRRKAQKGGGRISEQRTVEQKSLQFSIYSIYLVYIVHI